MASVRVPSSTRSIASVSSLRQRAPCGALRARVAVQSVRAEVSYVMVKPDGVQRGLVGEIIGRFERKGFQIKGLKMFSTPRSVAEEHYKDLSSKPFYKDLVNYILSGPVVCIVRSRSLLDKETWACGPDGAAVRVKDSEKALEGKGVVKSARKLIGATNPLESEPGTIRGDYAIQVGRNVIHGSDSPENGEREIGLWFNESELCDWQMHMDPWLNESNDP